MNERIKLLAEQANEAFYQRMGEGADRGTFYFNGFAEKFAELIIQECIKVAEKDWYTPDGWGWTSGQAKATEFIKEHFGVEI